jgi:hypothetical protein
MPPPRGVGLCGHGWVPGLGPGAGERGSPRTPSRPDALTRPGERHGRRRRRRQAAARGRFRVPASLGLRRMAQQPHDRPGAAACVGPLSGGAQKARSTCFEAKGPSTQCGHRTCATRPQRNCSMHPATPPQARVRDRAGGFVAGGPRARRGRFRWGEAPGSRGREQEHALQPSGSKRRSRNFDRAVVFAEEPSPNLLPPPNSTTTEIRTSRSRTLVPSTS